MPYCDIPSNANEDMPKLPPQHEPEVKSKRTDAPSSEKKQANPNAGRPLGTITNGTMAREDFRHVLDQTIVNDDRVAAFYAAITALRAAGAEVSLEGEQVLGWLRALGESVKGMKVATALFAKATTLRLVLRHATATMKRRGKPDEPAKPDASAKPEEPDE